jgi:hypothetical protein
VKIPLRLSGIERFDWERSIQQVRTCLDWTETRESSTDGYVDSVQYQIFTGTVGTATPASSAVRILSTKPNLLQCCELLFPVTTY